MFAVVDFAAWEHGPGTDAGAAFWLIALGVSVVLCMVWLCLETWGGGDP